jgi:hypothetical protein
MKRQHCLKNTRLTPRQLAALSASYAERMAAEYGMELADWMDLQARLSALNAEANSSR